MKSLFFSFALILFASALANERTRYTQNRPDETLLFAYQTAPTITDGTGGTATTVSTPVLNGALSTRLTVGATNVGFRSNITPANICADSAFRISFYFPNKQNIVNLARFDVAIRNDGSNYILSEFSFFVDTNLVRERTWTHWTLHRRDFTQVGTFDCATADEVKVTLRADASTQDTVYIAEFASFRLPTIATLILSTDDNWADFYELGYAPMIAKGYCHTAFINSGLVGTSLKLTKNQLDTYVNESNGLMRIGSHLDLHDTTTRIGPDSTKRNLQKSYEFHRQNNYPGSPRFLAYPYGRSTTVIDSAIQISGLVDFQRGVREMVNGIIPPYFNPYALPTIGTFGNTMTVAQGTNRIDSLVARKTTGIFYGHRLCDGCTTDGQTWDVDEFTAMLDSIQVRVSAGTLRVECLDTYMDTVATSRRAAPMGFRIGM